MLCVIRGCGNQARWGLYDQNKIWIYVCDACEKTIGDINQVNNGGILRGGRK